MKRGKWIQKCEVDERLLPVPTQIVSNEEFAPPDQTDEQRRSSAERAYRFYVEEARRAFLSSTGGMAAAEARKTFVIRGFWELSMLKMMRSICR
ncbi:MAG TPA: hypothetical protein PLK77_03490 [Pyrinomonadaceae bacterium]|nr:hypothetical protein [Pyrinomonadaceae bacterium]